MDCCVDWNGSRNNGKKEIEISRINSSSFVMMGRLEMEW